ncbi:DUF3889 domain-containing protein [Paenibacillus sp. GSMTC-2017]|uniref:DUF3889 domain-containing protein n=1 Tax=Paenibacillus sp. GSMTC-2017 TaxID=2794350 RepID=UPI0018D699E2|nr:DUF3889 domain-containing protein [Paenibacillus sp. GSMTC-2017]MBH5316540.1 DUF3889 domain-containing protein [Paenibacillus sp. GSMTC-2017]
MFGNIIVKAVFLLLSMAYTDSKPIEPVHIHASAPSYAKWGRMAMEETAKAYRDSSIIDYKYEGRFETNNENAEERFLLWLVHDGREFGVRVTITIRTSTDTFLSSKIEEIPSRS